jgi:cell filamentation protein, protein adenylyltransferase
VAWNPHIPYDDLPLLPPGTEVETRAVLKATTAARAAVAALDQAAQLLPNPRVLLNAALVLEAQASSEIEDIVTTADALFKYAQTEDPDDGATREALRYRAALFEGVRAIEERPLTAGTASRVCTRIKDREMAIRKLPGTRIAHHSTGRIIYSPPEGESLIVDKMANWEKFVHALDDLDPLVRMAIAHYQFEAIHPFSDGNGRTGRIMNILMLIQSGLISEPILYLSRSIIRSKNEYYQRLNDVTSEGAWESWILYMLRAVEQTATSTLAKIAAIRTAQADIHEKARMASRGGQNADFLAVLFEQVYCQISTVVERCGVSRPTATSWLNALVQAEILTKLKLGRHRLFVNDRFRDVLTRDEMASPEASK